MDNFLVRYTCRVVIYKCSAVIRLATGFICLLKLALNCKSDQKLKKHNQSLSNLKK